MASIRLRDGRKVELAGEGDLTVGDLRYLQKRGLSIKRIQEGIAAATAGDPDVDLLSALLFVRAKRSDPAVTEADIDALGAVELMAAMDDEQGMEVAPAGGPTSSSSNSSPESSAGDQGTSTG